MLHPFVHLKHSGCQKRPVNTNTLSICYNFEVWVYSKIYWLKDKDVKSNWVESWSVFSMTMKCGCNNQKSLYIHTDHEMKLISLCWKAMHSCNCRPWKNYSLIHLFQSRAVSVPFIVLFEIHWKSISWLSAKRLMKYNTSEHIFIFYILSFIRIWVKTSLRIKII